MLVDGLTTRPGRLIGGPEGGQGRWARTRRQALGAVAALAGGAVGAACSAPGGAGQQTPNTAVDTPAKLLVKIRSGPTYEMAFKEGIAQYKQKFPKTEIDYFPEESGWQDKLLASWAGGAGRGRLPGLGQPLLALHR